MAKNYPAITVGKLDAARRQLQTAITLWFAEGDPVSTHTLAYAAYEIIHVVSKQRNPNRRDLLFDTLMIKDEFRREFADLIKKDANFFKHAKADTDLTIEFRPQLTEFYMMYAILGVQLCGERLSNEEAALAIWYQLHKPELLTPAGNAAFDQRVPIKERAYIKGVPKHEFLQVIEVAASQQRP